MAFLVFFFFGLINLLEWITHVHPPRFETLTLTWKGLHTRRNRNSMRRCWSKECRDGEGRCLQVRFSNCVVGCFLRSAIIAHPATGYSYVITTDRKRCDSESLSSLLHILFLSKGGRKKNNFTDHADCASLIASSFMRWQGSLMAFNEMVSGSRHGFVLPVLSWNLWNCLRYLSPTLHKPLSSNTNILIIHTRTHSILKSFIIN